MTVGTRYFDTLGLDADARPRVRRHRRHARPRSRHRQSTVRLDVLRRRRSPRAPDPAGARSADRSRSRRGSQSSASRRQSGSATFASPIPIPSSTCPIAWRPAPSMTLLIGRTPGEPSAMTSTLREEVRALDPDLPLFGIATMDADHRADAIVLPRLRHDVRDVRASSRSCCRRWASTR